MVEAGKFVITVTNKHIFSAKLSAMPKADLTKIYRSMREGGTISFRTQ